MRGRMYVSVGELRLGLGVRSDVGCDVGSGLGLRSGLGLGAGLGF